MRQTRHEYTRTIVSQHHSVRYQTMNTEKSKFGYDKRENLLDFEIVLTVTHFYTKLMSRHKELIILCDSSSFNGFFFWRSNIEMKRLRFEKRSQRNE